MGGGCLPFYHADQQGQAVLAGNVHPMPPIGMNNVLPVSVLIDGNVTIAVLKDVGQIGTVHIRLFGGVIGVVGEPGLAVFQEHTEILFRPIKAPRETGVGEGSDLIGPNNPIRAISSF